MAVRLPRYARNDGGVWKDLEWRAMIAPTMGCGK